MTLEELGRKASVILCRMLDDEEPNFNVDEALIAVAALGPAKPLPRRRLCEDNGHGRCLTHDQLIKECY